MDLQLRIPETRENLIHTVDASRAETSAIKLNTMEQFYEKVARVHVQKEMRKQTQKQAELKMEVEDEEEDEELKLREKIAHHLNKARFEVDSQVMLVDLMQGSKSAGYQKQLLPQLVKQQEKERVEANHIEVMKEQKRAFLLKQVEKLKVGVVRLGEKYTRSKRTSSELFEFAQRWRLRMPEGARVDNIVHADYQFLPEGRPATATLEINEEGLLSMTLRDKQKSDLEGTRTVHGWKKCSAEVEIAQRKMLYLELFLALRSGVGKCGYEVDVDWGRLKVRGKGLGEIEFQFKGLGEGWNELQIKSVNLPPKMVPQLEKMALQALVNLPERSDLLGILIKQVRQIKQFVQVDQRIQAKFGHGKKFSVVRKISKQEKRIVIKNRKQQTMLEVTLLEQTFRIQKSWMRYGRRKENRTKRIETDSLAQLDSIMDELLEK